jgi:hypothetical protein
LQSSLFFFFLKINFDIITSKQFKNIKKIIFFKKMNFHEMLFVFQTARTNSQFAGGCDFEARILFPAIGPSRRVLWLDRECEPESNLQLNRWRTNIGSANMALRIEYQTQVTWED